MFVVAFDLSLCTWADGQAKRGGGEGVFARARVWWWWWWWWGGGTGGGARVRSLTLSPHTEPRKTLDHLARAHLDSAAAAPATAAAARIAVVGRGSADVGAGG